MQLNGAQAKCAETPPQSAEHHARLMPVMTLKQVEARRQFLLDVMRTFMHRGVDFRKAVDPDRELLLQPGADKLCTLFGIVIDYEVTRRIEHWKGPNGEPFFFYEVNGKAYREKFFMGEGAGSCNSLESKYRWQTAKRSCPRCHTASIIKGKKEYGGGWVCYVRKGGCGQKFKDGDAAIEEQVVGRTENGNVADQVNSILKIAYRRSKISTTINATCSSEFFTPGFEDFTAPREDPPLLIDTGGPAVGTVDAAAFVAEQKLRAGTGTVHLPWKNRQEMAARFRTIRERVGEVVYRSELERYGWTRFDDIKNAIECKTPLAESKAAEVYIHLITLAEGRPS